MAIPLTRANITSKEIDAVSRVLKSGWLTMGPETAAFEEEFARFVGAKYAIAVNSATAALFLSLKALGIDRNDEVVVPSFTFASSANVIVHCGAKPVFADINLDDFTMDQKSFEKVVNNNVKAVIPVHYGGSRSIIKTNIPLIEDSAHLIQKNMDNNKAFTSCYSFYATKNITTGEGGMITTNDKNICDWLKMARLHGLSKDAWKRYNIGSKWIYSVEFNGWKYNTTDMNSALGRVQLKRIDTFEKKRREIVSIYNKEFGLNNKGTHLYPILVEKRDEFFELMQNNQVGCSFHFTPLHLQPAFKKYKSRKLPNTEFVGKRVVTLPLDSVITKSEALFIAKLAKPYVLKPPYNVS